MRDAEGFEELLPLREIEEVELELVPPVPCMVDELLIL